MINASRGDEGRSLASGGAKAPRAEGARVGLAALLGCLGCSAMLGWTLREPMMFMFWPGGAPVSSAAGLGMALCGVSVALLGAHGEWARGAGWALSFAVGALGAVSLAEFGFDASLDGPWLGAWTGEGEGRMGPSSALGFMLCGAGLGLWRGARGRWGSMGLMSAALALAMVAAAGALGSLLAPDPLFGWGGWARMPLPTAAGMLACAAALWMGGASGGWRGELPRSRHGGMMRVAGAAILVAGTAAAGMTGFALMQGGIQDALEKDAREQLDRRLDLLHGQAVELASSGEAALRLSGAEAAAARVLAMPEGPERQSALLGYEERAGAVLGEGYRGVALRDGRGRVVSRLGRLDLSPAIRAGLGVEGAWLVWDQGFALRRTLAVGDGALELDREASAMSKSLFDIRGGGEVSLCVEAGGGQSCFPNALRARPFAEKKWGGQSGPHPMERATRGESGGGTFQDPGGKSVYAAYAPVAANAGMVVKQDLFEAYAPQRSALGLGALVVMGIAGLGAVLLRARLSPWERQMVESEREARARADEANDVLLSVADAIVTVGRDGLVESFNPAACALFGWSAAELEGMPLSGLMPERFRQRHEDGIRRLAAGGAPRVMGKGPLEVAGKRRDGTEFAMELSVSGVERRGERRFVGVMRDVSERKAAEAGLERRARHDDLTKLPNRASFKEALEREVGALPSSDYAVVFLDLDGFKAINDERGHGAGDEVLAELARRLLASAGPGDTVARLAGDEFTMLLTGMADGELRGCDVAGQILQAVGRPFALSGGGEVGVTASVGVAVQRPTERRLGASAILHLADQMMYEAKRAGKNQFRMRILEPGAEE